MKTKSLTILLAAVGTLLTLGLSAQPVSRTLFNDGWTFTKDGVSRVLDLPHDWGVEGDFDISYPSESGKLAWWGKAEYSKTLKVEGKGSKQYFLDIDGAMQWAKVFCNGEYVTEWPYGYASWQADLTPFIKEGDNEIKVTIDNPEESSRWYPGGGIYRNVWLTVADPVGVAHWGTFVTTEGEKVNLEVTLRNAGEAVGGKVRTEIFEYDGRKAVASAETVVDTIRDGIVVNEEFLLKRARRWSPEEPNLYKAVTTVTAGDSKDEYVTVFGLRDLEYKEDGLYINSEKTFLKGVCLHHDAGALGAAWNTTAWTRRLLMLKEMGCNAIRTSHNPPAPELLELCDKMGFVVLDEFSDTWSIPKRKNGYAVLFENWFEKDMAALVRRDRNHPSVIMWSIGNEVPEQGYPDKYWIAYRLTEICHELDPTRLTTVGSDNPWASEQDFRNAVDAYGFNYKPHLYAKFHEANPGKVYYGSETESTISSRGVYMFPLGTTVEAAEQDFQVCSYDLHTVPWGQIPEQEWKFEDENPACLGEFVWTGYDYLGEPTPYNSDLTILSNFHDPKSLERAKKELEEKGRISSPSRSSYFGIIDLAGFPKDRYWLYQARWTEKPVLHVLPHWNWAGREGEVTPVHVYTNCDKAELFINGKSQGVRERAEGQYRLRWDEVVYEPGNVKVIAWKDGKKYIENIGTTKAPKKITLEVEEGFGDGDIFFVDVRIEDKKGQMVPTACNELRFKIKGPGEILAVDSGDATCLTPFRSDHIAAFNGLSSVIIRPTGKGRIVLTAEGDGLKKAKVRIRSK